MTGIKILIPEELVTAIERTCKDFNHNVIYKRGARPKIQISEAEKQFDLIIETAKKEKIFVFLDEIQKLEDFQNKIKIYYDLYPKIKFFLSGSSSLFLKKKKQENTGL